jgi:non-specific serine/threonine protein kinase/serine/threonine-protein kinase
MTAEQFRLVEEQFHALVDLPRDQQRRELRRLEQVDREVATEVASLLDLEAEQSSPTAGLASPLGELIGPTDPDLGDGGDAEGWVGPYRLVRHLGQGGMGAVYEALQEEPLRRTVAIKLIKAGMDSAALVARFESERQALALMDHPGIARVFDAGTTRSGRPYFAMELVSGEPLTEYCDQRRLSLARRVELFAQLCDAVQHAHQKGIIHRDLKPSNILVEEVDGVAVPKVIDFGIAKAITPEVGTGAPHTQLGAVVGTPDYMSPEQAASGGADIDVRSDVYSLGVVLHELLTGELPVPPEVRQAGADAVRRHVASEEPRRPSQRVSRLPARDEVSERREVDASALARSLRGDLDWILLEALAREREQRYAAAAELAADCRRYLRHEPVLAGPPSAAYRARKFVRRHRLLVAAAVLVLGAVLLGAALATVGLLRARASEGRAQEARRQAEREAEIARQIADFLVGLFRVSDPGEARGNEVTARELLERGAEHVREELRQQPEVQARLMHTMGDVYSELGLYGESEELLEEALRLRRVAVGERSEEAAETLDELASLRRRRYELGAAQAAYREALAIREATLGPDHPDVAGSLSNLAIAHRLAGETAAARPLLERALEITESHAPAVQEGDYDDAARYLERSLDILRSELGEDHPDVGVLLNNLGMVMRRRGDFRSARDAFRSSLDNARKSLDPAHPDIAMGLRNLAVAERALGAYEKARGHLERSLAILEGAMGADHLSVANAHSMLADLALHQDDLERARRHNQRALDLLAEPEGPQQLRRRLRVLEEQARVSRLLGDVASARALCERAVEGAVELPEPDVEAARCRLQLAMLAAAEGDRERSRQLYASATRGMSEEEPSILDDLVGVASRTAYWLAAGEIERAGTFLELALETGGVEAWTSRNPDLAAVAREPALAPLGSRLRPGS